MSTGNKPPTPAEGDGPDTVTPNPHAHLERTRDGHGDFTRAIDTVRRDTQAAELRAKSWSYQRIADELGWKHKSEAYRAVQRVLRDTMQEAGDELRAVERERLDRLSEAAWAVLDRQHITVSNGQIIRLGGEPVVDDGPTLQAIDRLLRISESRRKLEGLDAPSRVSVDAMTLGEEITGILDRLATTASDDGDG